MWIQLQSISSFMNKKPHIYRQNQIRSKQYGQCDTLIVLKTVSGAFSVFYMNHRVQFLSVTLDNFYS